MVTKRRICWPNPDATCLEGGCSWCNDHPFRSVATIRWYAERAGIVPNRCKGDQSAMVAFQLGVDAQWFGNVGAR